ncbi:MAG: pilus assembly protein PilM [Bacilli bacterium]|nr:pilus assembly protein PilM [Bacilli bacterium]
MRNIYTGIDIGSDSIKIVVAELVGEKFYVLASTSVKTVGVRRGIVVDHNMVVSSLKLAIEEIENTLGLKITKAVITVPSNDRNLSVVDGKIEISKEQIDGDDVVSVLQEATVEKIGENDELVSIIPIMFSLDEDKFTDNPNGMISKSLGVKALLALAPKKQIFDVLKVFSDLNIEIVDITFGCIGDYYEAKTKDMDAVLGAIINVGHEKINVSIFNKGILIKDSIINLGSKNIDKDISYVYGVDLNSARELKEKFALCSRRYADINETLDFSIEDGQSRSINQYEITEIVEARVVELLKLAKKEINNLTKRKISYIIVTGGITELMGFSYVVENILGINSSTMNATTMGIRNNKFSSAMGVIKYFHEKMKLRDKNLSFVDSESIEQMIKNKKSMLELTDDTIISKIFGYFSNN